MSYILYASIARAGGIDLLLGNEAFVTAPDHPLRRRASRPGRLRRLRRTSGRALIALGGRLTRWGRAWAPAATGAAA